MNGSLNISEPNIFYQFYIDTNLGLLGYPIVGTAQVVMLVKLIFKHHDKVEPVHIYEFSSLTSIAIYTVVALVSSLEKFYPSWMCCIFNPLFYFCKLSCLANWCVTIIDCCLALHWNLSYKTRVTNTVAIITTFVVNTSIFVINIIIIYVDSDILKCNKSSLLVCNNIRENNFYWNTIPVMVTIFIYVICSIYISWVIKKHSNQVHPIVNLPPPIQVNVKTISGQMGKTKFNNLDQQIHDDEIVAEAVDIEEMEDVHVDIDGEASEARNKKTKQEVILNCVKIKRSSSDPFKFKKVETKIEFLKTCSIPNIISENTLQRAKKMLNLTLLSFLSVLCLIPPNIIHVYVFVTGSKCEDDFELIAFGKIGCIMSSCGSLVYYAVAMRKLNN